MKKKYNMIQISSLLKDEFAEFNHEKKPSVEFKEFLESLEDLDRMTAVDILSSVFSHVNEKRNYFYLNFMFWGITNFIDANVFYLLEELNTSLDLVFSVGDVKAAFRILKMIGSQADSRTLDILHRYSTLYRDRSVLTKIIKCRKEIEKKVTGLMKRIEFMEIEPIISFYDKWQE